ncbi:5'-3' exonuclease [Labilithrix luteola]|uniref:5'-3' exonuclease n=1 Tax=Labilithrix luteola TaxID=1391654 RepID=UPI0011BAD9FF|nr:5'-3' exonuclease H3TH domain-containing protein [Labilithrix luteola]
MRVHLVDGTFELFRAHFSQRPSKVVGGVDVKATAGLISSMLTLLEEQAEAVTHLAIAFDNPIVSFRNDLFDGYKSDEGVPASLRGQFDLAEEAMKALGIVVWSMDQYEADDALATGAVRFSKSAKQIRILSPDKDLGQVVSGDRIVQLDRIRKKVIDEDAVVAARGVPPASIPDLLALVGDTADGIPGLAGFGAKSAAKLLARWGTIEAIPEDPAKWDVAIPGAPRLGATLAAERDDALLYKKLATLVTDVPLKESLTDLEFRGVPHGPFEALCDRLDLTETRKRPKRWA